ncbi:MAG: hypothetical protein M1508_08345 [Nitrospirae bacterium]|nr:hypothetical protein [Nitrospirota bacterium]MCL5422006.1 hypothetical protein [Nitrospirota bacterium]
MNYNWRGNIRELENVIERAMTLMDGDMITVSNLPDYIFERDETREIKRMIPTLREMEKMHILHVLKESGGDRARAAEILGIDKTTLWRKTRRYGVA